MRQVVAHVSGRDPGPEYRDIVWVAVVVVLLVAAVFLTLAGVSHEAR